MPWIWNWGLGIGDWGLGIGDWAKLSKMIQKLKESLPTGDGVIIDVFRNLGNHHGA